MKFLICIALSLYILPIHVSAQAVTPGTSITHNEFQGMANRFKRVAEERAQANDETNSHTLAVSSTTVLAFLLILNGLVFRAACNYLARRKGQAGTTWAIAGFFLNLVALLVLIGLPKKNGQSVRAETTKPLSDEFKQCPYCAEQVRQAAIKCRFCQSDLAL